jgi:hypothetical protein
VAATPGVIAKVGESLPKDFPTDMAEGIFRGLEESAKTLNGQHN